MREQKRELLKQPATADVSHDDQQFPQPRSVPRRETKSTTPPPKLTFAEPAFGSQHAA